MMRTLPWQRCSGRETERASFEFAHSFLLRQRSARGSRVDSTSNLDGCAPGGAGGSLTQTAVATAYHRDILRAFRLYKTMGERAIAQVTSDEDLHHQIDPESNSIAVIVKHVGGNLRSRFRDFLTTDGEKPDRNRDSEFEVEGTESRDTVMRWWSDGWTVALESIEALGPEDLERTVRIRDEAFLVVEALNRSANHIAYHVGQIVYLARHFRGTSWTTLSIPKGRSAEFSVGKFKT